jgi:hypothetical protein
LKRWAGSGQRVNLLERRLSGRRPLPVNRSVMGFALLAVVSWAVAGLGAALLLGWHPWVGVLP